MSLRVDPKGTYVPECNRCFDEFGSYSCLRPAHKTRGRSFIADAFEGIREAASRDLAAIVDREITAEMTPDFYQQAADAFGMTRAEAKLRILEAMTTETPAGKRRRELRAFIAYLRSAIGDSAMNEVRAAEDKPGRKAARTMRPIERECIGDGTY